MPDIGAEIRAILAADSSVTAIVDNRIFSDSEKTWQSVVSGERYVAGTGADGLPVYSNRSIDSMVTYDVIGEDAMFTLSGRVGTDKAEVQIDCYASNERTTSVSLWNACRDALLGYSGTADQIYIRQITKATGHYYDRMTSESPVVRNFYVTTQRFYVFYDS